MVLLTSLNNAISGLNAAMAALHTTGHNIANATTPGYSRQRVELVAQRPQDMVRFQIGRGVEVGRIARILDTALEGRLREAGSRLGQAGVGVDVLRQLESLTNALQGSDLGGQINQLFEALHDLAGNPDGAAARTAVVQAGRAVAETFNYLSRQIRLLREQTNDEVVVTVDQVNRITGELADLNRQIVSAENGGQDLGTANDLRDRRDFLLRELSQLVGVSAVEVSSGALNVLSGSAFLVFGQQAFDLTTQQSVVDGLLIETPVFANGSAALDPEGGKLRGLLDARDVTLREFQRQLDVLAHAMAFEFNKVQSTGQGLQRFDLLTSEDALPVSTVPVAIEGSATAVSTLNSITDTSLVGFPDQTGREILILSGANVLEKRTITAFDAATGTIFLNADLPASPAIGDRFQITELEFPVRNGSFDFVVTDENTGVQETFTLTVDLDKIGADTTLADIAGALNAALPGVATILSDGRLRLQTASPSTTIAFAGDTSGFVAAMGLNTFFQGSRGDSIAMNPTLLSSPDFLSAAQSNNAGDNSNATAFTGLRSQGLVNGRSFEEFYAGIVGDLGSRTAAAQNLFENQEFIGQQLENQRERISGVNIDEEAVKMLEYQRAYQASARFIAVVDSVLDTLINGI